MPIVDKIKLFDLPTSAGCLERGTECLPGHFRKHGLLESLNRVNVQVTDLGEISVPEEPRHNNPPIRNFPLSQEVWTRTETFLLDHFSSEPRTMILGLGGDCSMVVGTTSSAIRVFNNNVHVLYLDGDVDSIAPDSNRCQGSAGMGLWLLTQKSEFWNRDQLSPSQITVLGNKKPPDTDLGIPFVSLEELRATGIRNAVIKVLSAIPERAHILVHFDVDLISQAEMPAAYAPREEGLSLYEAEIMLAEILKDSRIRYLEFSEFVPSKDPEGRAIKDLIGILSKSLAGDAKLDHFGGNPAPR